MLDKLFKLVVVVGIVAIFVVARPPTPSTIGSVEAGHDYYATSTRTTAAVGANTNVTVRTGPSTLGSVVVASSSAQGLTFWSATSTTDLSSSTIFALDAAVAEGTYTFDAIFDRGIAIQMPAGFNGDYIITYR